MAHKDPSGASPIIPIGIQEGNHGADLHFRVTLKTLTEAFKADFDDMTSLKKQVERAVSIDPLYKEAAQVRGLKDNQVFIIASLKEVVTSLFLLAQMRLSWTHMLRAQRRLSQA